MRAQSFINFLREEEGKADRQKVLSLSALIGGSLLAQLMFAGVTQAAGCPIACGPDCSPVTCIVAFCPDTCLDL